MARPSPALVVAFLALLVSASGVAFATIPARDGDVHACYFPRTGQIELVDTQRDRFRCERNWRGLTFDTSPSRLVSPRGQLRIEGTNTASRLVSPNGQFKIEATDDGASLIGPQGRIDIGTSKVSVAGDIPIEVTGNTTVNVTGGSEVNLTGGRKVGLVSGQDMNLNASRNVSIEGTDQAQLRARRTIVEGFVETRVLARDLAMVASGAADLNATGSLDLRGNPTRINGTAQTGE
jgi:hypothetical protein